MHAARVAPSVSPMPRLLARLPLRTSTLVAAVLAALLLALVAPVTASAATYPLGRGSTGTAVSEVQKRLGYAGIYSSGVTGYYGTATESAVRHFQEKFRLSRTGRVDSSTMAKLRSVTYRNGVLPGICRTGRVICIDKTQRLLRYLDGGRAVIKMDARFGRPGMETREGRFRVFRKTRNARSSIYNTPMPFAMSFSGGQAIHYSADFEARGYAGGSHGCVNTRNWAAVSRLFDLTPIGRTVYVYR